MMTNHQSFETTNGTFHEATLSPVTLLYPIKFFETSLNIVTSHKPFCKGFSKPIASVLSAKFNGNWW